MCFIVALLYLSVLLMYLRTRAWVVSHISFMHTYNFTHAHTHTFSLTGKNGLCNCISKQYCMCLDLYGASRKISHVEMKSLLPRCWLCATVVICFAVRQRVSSCVKKSLLPLTGQTNQIIVMVVTNLYSAVKWEIHQNLGSTTIKPWLFDGIYDAKCHLDLSRLSLLAVIMSEPC